MLEIMSGKYVLSLGACGEAFYVFKKEDTYIDGWGFLRSKPGSKHITTIVIGDSIDETIEAARAAIVAIDAIEKARDASKIFVREEQLLNVA